MRAGYGYFSNFLSDPLNGCRIMHRILIILLFRIFVGGICAKTTYFKSFKIFLLSSLSDISLVIFISKLFQLSHVLCYTMLWRSKATIEQHYGTSLWCGTDKTQGIWFTLGWRKKKLWGGKAEKDAEGRCRRMGLIAAKCTQCGACLLYTSDAADDNVRV